MDALRGLAALAVLCHHLYHNSEFQQPLAQVFPAAVCSLFTFGARGVQIFFVISGFVIAHSMRQTLVTPATAANFALRRQIRLDPTYWVVLTLATASALVAARVHHFDPQYIRPGFADVVANLLYLQGVLHRVPIVSVAWTLCLEIQFYLFFLLILSICQRLPGTKFLGATPAVLATTAIASATMQFLGIGGVDNPWLFQTWHMFAVGALCYYAVERRASGAWLAVALVPALAAAICRRSDAMVVAVATALLLYSLGKARRLETWTLGRPVQYLGAISYSLYLIHLEVVSRVFKTGMHVTGLSRSGAILWFVVAALSSVAAAHVLNRYVEEPTRRLASRAKSSRRARPLHEAAASGGSSGSGTSTA